MMTLPITSPYFTGAHRPRPLAFGSHSNIAQETLIARKGEIGRYHKRVLELGSAIFGKNKHTFRQDDLNAMVRLIDDMSHWLTRPEREYAWTRNASKGHYEPIPELQEAVENALLDISQQYPGTLDIIVQNLLIGRNSYTPSLPFWEQLNIRPIIRRGLDTLEDIARSAKIPVKLSAAQARTTIPPDAVITAKTEVADRFIKVLRRHQEGYEKTLDIADDIVRWLIEPSPYTHYWYFPDPGKEKYLPMPEIIRLAEAAIIGLAREVPGFRHEAITIINNQNKQTKSPYTPSHRFWELLNGLAR